MNRESCLLIVFLLLLLPQAAPAGTEHHHEDHDEPAASSGPHVHGEVLLNLVIEGDEVAVEMISPAMNLVGFEHPPATQAQRDSVDRVLARLSDPETLISLPPGANCELLSSEVETALAMDAESGSGHDAHDHAAHAAGHADVQVLYQMRCANAGAIDTLMLALFGAFPGIESVRLQWINNQEQGAVQRDASNPVVDLR